MPPFFNKLLLPGMSHILQSDRNEYWHFSSKPRLHWTSFKLFLNFLPFTCILHWWSDLKRLTGWLDCQTQKKWAFNESSQNISASSKTCKSVGCCLKPSHRPYGALNRNHNTCFTAQMWQLLNEAVYEKLAWIWNRNKSHLRALFSFKDLLLTFEPVGELPTSQQTVTGASSPRICPQHLSRQIYRLMRTSVAWSLCVVIHHRPLTEYDAQRQRRTPLEAGRPKFTLQSQTEWKGQSVCCLSAVISGQKQTPELGCRF